MYKLSWQGFYPFKYLTCTFLWSKTEGKEISTGQRPWDVRWLYQLLSFHRLPWWWLEAPLCSVLSQTVAGCGIRLLSLTGKVTGIPLQWLVQKLDQTIHSCYEYTFINFFFKWSKNICIYATISTSKINLAQKGNVFVSRVRVFLIPVTIFFKEQIGKHLHFGLLNDYFIW